MKALCFGINNYPGNSSDLAGCVPDSNGWTALLRKRGYEVVNLKNKEATNTRVLDEAAQVVADTPTGDGAPFNFITLSTHGTYLPDRSGDEPGGWDEAVVAYQGLIVDDAWAELFGKLKPNARLLFFVDCCFAGTMNALPMPVTRGLSAKSRFVPPSMVPLEDGGPTQLVPQAVAEQRAKTPGAGRVVTPGVACLFACTANEESYEDRIFSLGVTHGVWSYAAQAVLSRVANPTVWNLYHAAYALVVTQGAINQGLWYPQTPQLVCEKALKGQHVFGKKN